jgi:hypothetical protein
MTRTRAAATLVAVAILAIPFVVPPSARAQAVPPKLPAFDAAVLAGWGALRGDEAATYDSWDGVSVVALAIGYYWTDNLKTELQLQTGTEASYYGYPEVIRVPGIAVPVYRSFEQRAHVTSIAPAVHYQFFRNQWFHPFLGAGVSLDRDRVRRVYPEQPVPTGANGGPPWAQLPREEQPTRTTIVPRPLLLGGFKAYVASRAFLRTDASATFVVRSRAMLRWQVGVGFDF